MRKCVSCAALWVLAGCSSGDADELVGTWTRDMSALRFTESGLSASAAGGVAGLATPDATGTYTTDGDTIAITDTGGPYACPAENVGSYEFELEGDTLTFKLKSDTCQPRVGALTTGIWKGP